MVEEPYLIEENPLGITVRTTSSHWDKIVSLKHPVMHGREQEVRQTLRQPDEIRRSGSDPSVLIHYRQAGHYHLCVVVKRLNREGFIITAYPTDVIKEGEPLWTQKG